jgi:hypothetical protein
MIAKTQLFGDLRLYPPGSRKGPIHHGYKCPCYTQKDMSTHGWDCLILLGEPPLAPGQFRRVGFVFLSGQEAVEALTRAGMFYLWERGFIGEATELAVPH